MAYKIKQNAYAISKRDGDIWKMGKKALLLLLLFFSAACKKDNQSPNTGLQDGKSIVVTDLAGDTEAALTDDTPGKQKRPFYSFLFRFSDQKQTWLRTEADTAQYLNTEDWDIAFGGNYNSEITVNGAVVKVDKAYAQVNEAPSDEVFNQSQINKFGWAEAEGSPGWYTYSITTHIMQRLPNRTYLIKLNSGKFAKLELLSVYKGNPPAVTDLYWPAPYLTFRYYVQADGSRNLNTQ